MTEPKILFFDLETAPLLVWTFNLFKTTIGINQIKEPGRVICWSARWRGDKGKKVMFNSEYESSSYDMLVEMRDLLDEADVVVTYNGDSFDVPWLNEEFITMGIELPSPYQQVDLYKLNKRHLYLPSRKLDWMAWTFLAERKETHSGFQLWIDCIAGEGNVQKRAWALMKKYAMKDTYLLDPLFEVMKPFVRSINWGLYESKDFVCTHCGSDHLQARGFSYTVAGKYQRYQCVDCGSWSKDPKRIGTTSLRPMSNN